MSGGLATSGAISLGAPLSKGTAGQAIYSGGASGISNWKASTGVQVTSATLNYGTTSTAQVHAGLGSSWTFTPATTGNVLLLAQCLASSSTVDGYGMQIRYGTGAAPAQGAAATGTAVGIGSIVSVAPGGGDQSTLNCSYFLSGLTVGTTYWADLGVYAITGGTATFAAADVKAIEIGA